jgi:hypothetical protein
MKQYRQGKNCDKLLKLLEYRSGAIMEGSQVKQVIATPKIIGDRLFMRLQTAYVIPPEQSSQIYLLRRNLLKCPHTDRWSRDNTIATRRLFQRFTALESILNGRQEHIINCQCKLCPTEFQLSLERFEEGGLVLFITKWQELGTGLSPLESDLPLVFGPRRIIRIGERHWLMSHLGSDLRNLLQAKISKLFLLLSMRKEETCSERATQGWRNV